MRIGVDAMGGDFAPLEAVMGANLAAIRHQGWDIVLYGQRAAITGICQAEGVNQDLFTIIDCPSVIGMGEHPVKAFASKQDSSLAIGFNDLAAGKIDAFLSAGNTGVMLVGSLMTVKAVAGVQRPCLTSVLPRESGNPGLLLDVGANSDVKPEHLQQFARLGSEYYRAVYKVASPAVGLLNIGEEEEKGSILTKAAHELLKDTEDINFIGNIESRDVFNSGCDVVVCDGFTGNMIIKLCEGLYYKLMKRGVNDEFLDRFNFKHYGGSSVLGVNAPVIVGHGITKRDTFVKMIEMAADQVESGLVEHIQAAFNVSGSSGN